MAPRLIGLSFFILLASTARAAYHASGDGRLDALAAESTSSPQQLSSLRLSIFAEEKFTFTHRFSAVVGGQDYFESQYYANPQYTQQVRDEDSTDPRFQDTYLQYKTNHFTVRAGYQRIVWGETFGNFYADIVNPKDLRQGVPAESSNIRLAVPLLNVQYIQRRFSAQAIFLPQSFYNILPLTGSEYSLPLAKMTGFQNVVIERERNSIWAPEHAEWGGRISQTIGTFDLSAFEFTYFDRNPYYLVGPTTTPLTRANLELDEQHSRVNSFGTSIAADLDGFVLRGEGVYSNNRVLAAVSGSDIVDLLTDEIAYAISLDFPTWNRINLTLQYSESQLTRPGDYLIRAQEIQYFTTRALWSLFSESSLEFLMTYSARDGGYRTQAGFMTPLNSELEVHAGVENYNGMSDSDFGSISRASRVYLLLRAQFDSDGGRRRR